MTARRAVRGSRARTGSTVAASPAPGDVGVEGYGQAGKTVQAPPGTLRKANGSEAFGGCTVRSAISTRAERRHLRAAHVHLYAGQTPAPLAQADHAELAHVQRAEEQAVQQQAEQKIEPPRTSEAREGGEGSAKSTCPATSASLWHAPYRQI